MPISSTVVRNERADTLTTAERSERMSRVRSKDTKLELLVTTLVHRTVSAIRDTQILSDGDPR